MSNNTQELKAAQRREKFAGLLREMFQLDQPELDFGLYRIMHARKDDINRFIEQDLPSIARAAFSEFASLDKTQLEQALEQAKKGAADAGFNPEESPTVKAIQVQLKDGFDLAREEGEVYDALVTFFSRYYSEGDFLSRRVYKDGTYAIPYQGEEVVLHWANKDQYYIKSSETLRDYSFRLNPQAGLGEDPMRVHFKLVDADAGAKDNNKESDDNKRVFVLDVDAPFELIDGEPNEDGERHRELQLRFLFRAATAEDWTDTVKSKTTAAAQKKPPTQDHLRAIAEERLLGELGQLPAPWNAALGRSYAKANGERADYSTLQGQLNNYTKKNTFDYFIHKDLGGFLTRELDFYVKNELMDWSDIAALKHDPARLAPLLSKIEVIRNLGEKIISFLAQLENFQKKLWLKKKFVTETNYCITLDRIEQHPDLLRAVFCNDRQRLDWASLYKLDLAQLESDLKSVKGNGDYAKVLADPKYRYLMLDTAHFEDEFKASLLNTIEDLDEQCDGLLVHSENFQALNFIQSKYSGEVGVIYIDPPYNTGDDGFPYKDSYKDSSWLSMIYDRISASRVLMSPSASIAISIDDIEVSDLDRLVKQEFGFNELAKIIWDKNRKNDATFFSVGHEYMLVYAASEQTLRDGGVKFREPKDGIDEARRVFDKIWKRHNGDLDKVRESWLAWFKDISKADPRYKLRRFNKVCDKGPYRDDGNINWPGGGGPRYEVLHPSTQKICKVPISGWRYSDPERFWEEFEKGRISFGKDESTVPSVVSYLFDSDGQVMGSVHYSYAQTASQEFDALFGEKVFKNPKNWKDILRVSRYLNVSKGIVLDFFAGSGTTGHAQINLGREGGDPSHFILVDMGSSFKTVLLPRLKKTVYSGVWRDGEPEDRTSGVSQCIKYFALESYEDTLGNLALNRPSGQQSLLDASDESPLKQARRAYVMNYMLEVESRGSASLLNTAQFLDPTRYQLNVRSAGGDETKAVNVDLLETFNYLLGLRVEHIAAPLHFDADFSQGEYGRLQAKVNRSPEGQWWFRTVYGKNANGQAVLVVWRNLPSVIAGGDDGMQRDNAVLDAVLIEKLKIRLTESADDEIDILYVNGDHNIAIPRDRKGQAMEQARLQLIEETFHRLMFAGTESVQ
tara:strand:+ start:7803 stop:11201 length:3399 start_codon:yes stop_codon:yes gene_type:complete